MVLSLSLTGMFHQPRLAKSDIQMDGKMKKLISLITVLAATGCANNVWVHSSKNNAQFNQDKNDCIVQAGNAIPRQIVPQQPSAPPSYTTNCYGSSNMASCTTTPQVQPNYTATAQAIADGSTNRARDNYFSSCMQSRGWTLQSVESVATNQAQMRDRVEQFTAAMKDISNQTDQLCTQPQYAAYFAKSSCDPANSSLAELSDNSKATKQQKEAITKIDAALNELAKQRDDAFTRFLTPPALATEAVAFNRKAWNRFQKLRLDLYNGKITWGQFNTERKRGSEETSAEFKSILKKYEN